MMVSVTRHASWQVFGVLVLHTTICTLLAECAAVRHVALVGTTLRCNARNKDPCVTFPNLCSAGGGLCVVKGPCEYQCVCPPEGRIARDCIGGASPDTAAAGDQGPPKKEVTSLVDSLLVVPADLFWDMNHVAKPGDLVKPTTTTTAPFKAATTTPTPAPATPTMKPTTQTTTVTTHSASSSATTSALKVTPSTYPTTEMPSGHTTAFKLMTPDTTNDAPANTPETTDVTGVDTSSTTNDHLLEYSTTTMDIGQSSSPAVTAPSHSNLQTVMPALSHEDFPKLPTSMTAFGRATALSGAVLSGDATAQATGTDVSTALPSSDPAFHQAAITTASNTHAEPSLANSGEPTANDTSGVLNIIRNISSSLEGLTNDGLGHARDGQQFTRDTQTLGSFQISRHDGTPPSNQNLPGHQKTSVNGQKLQTSLTNPTHTNPRKESIAVTPHTTKTPQVTVTSVEPALNTGPSSGSTAGNNHQNLEPFIGHEAFPTFFGDSFREPAPSPDKGTNAPLSVMIQRVFHPVDLFQSIRRPA